MAKKSQAEILAKKAETIELVKVFQRMPIDKWQEYIDTNAPAADKEKNRHYRFCAKRALSIDNMADYIEAHDNKKASKKAFSQNSWTYQYEKVDVPTKNGKTKKEYKKDENGNNIPVLDENGEPIKQRSVFNAVSYFAKTYLNGLLDIQEEKKSLAFDRLNGWDD